MEPDNVGRKLGVGVRVASGMLRDRAGKTAQAVHHNAPMYAASGRNIIAGTKRGTKRFGEAIWGPFVHAGSVLWLEITGLFFGIFGLFFAEGVYRLRADWRSGPNHQRLLIYASVAMVFFYFSVSSFYRARRKQRRQRARKA